jgi:hypothetical protein
MMKVASICLFLCSVLCVFSIDAQTSKKQPTKPILSKPLVSICTGGILNMKAIHLPAPSYPSEAKKSFASMIITVMVEVSTEGNVTNAKACAGHPMLRPYAEAAALQAKIGLTKLSGIPVKVRGVLIYKFDPSK